MKLFVVQVGYDFRQTMDPKFDQAGVRTHHLQIMTVRFMSPRRLS